MCPKAVLERKIPPKYHLTKKKPYAINIIYLLCISDTQYKCFDVSMYKPLPHYGWSLAHCTDTNNWVGPGTYTSKCCVVDEVHTLTCSTGFYSLNDWSGSTLSMLGHKFCDDVVGYKAFIPLNITGGNKYTQNEFMISSLSQFIKL